MAKADFIPGPADELDTWEGTFFDNIDAVGTACGLTPQQISDVKDKITIHRANYTAQKNEEQVLAGKVQATLLNKKIAISDEGGVRKMVGIMKANPNYTLELGQQLGVEGPEITKGNQPTLKVALEAGNISIFYNKEKNDGIALLSQRGSEPDFVEILTDRHSPAVDNRPNLQPGVPEKRQYKAFFLKGDARIGTESAVVTITV